MQPNDSDGGSQTPVTFRSEVLKAWLECSEKNYQEQERIFDVLEGKAEKISAMAGVLIAAAFALINPQVELTLIAQRLGWFGLVSVAIGLIALVFCLIFCLKTLQVRRQTGPLSAEAMKKMALDLLALPSSDLAKAQYQEGYFHDQAHIWTKSVEGMASVTKSKAESVEKAQICLAVALFCALLVLGALIVRIGGRLHGGLNVTMYTQR